MKTEIDAESDRTHAARRRKAEQGILRAALQIIADRGVDRLTLAEAGERAGYSRALPAHYFGTRDELLVAVANHLIVGYRGRLFDTGPSEPGGMVSLTSLVTLYLDDGRRAGVRMRALFEILNAGLRDGPLKAAVARLNAESIAGFAQRIEQARSAGEIRDDIDPRAEAAILLAALRGLLNLWMAAPRCFDMDCARAALIAGLKRNWSVSDLTQSGS